MDSVGEGEGGKIWENGIKTCKISCMEKKKKKKWKFQAQNLILFLKTIEPSSNLTSVSRWIPLSIHISQLSSCPLIDETSGLY